MIFPKLQDNSSARRSGKTSKLVVDGSVPKLNFWISIMIKINQSNRRAKSFDGHKLFETFTEFKDMQEMAAVSTASPIGYKEVRFPVAGDVTTRKNIGRLIGIRFKMISEIIMVVDFSFFKNFDLSFLNNELSKSSLKILKERNPVRAVFFIFQSAIEGMGKDWKY